MKNCLQVDEQEQNLPGARREQYRDTQRESVDGKDSNHPLDISAEDLKVLQETDSSLESIRKAADGHASTAGVGFFRREGLLYRRWVPPDRGREDMSVEQLVLPLKLNIHGAIFTYSFVARQHVACSSKGIAVLHLWASMGSY